MQHKTSREELDRVIKENQFAQKKLRDMSEQEEKRGVENLTPEGEIERTESIDSNG